jgi:hypothetical protein
MANEAAIEIGQNVIGGLHIVKEAGEVLLEGAATQSDDLVFVRWTELRSGHNREVEGGSKVESR